MEHAQLLHLVTSILSGYLFVVFVAWWIIEGDPSPIYKLTCFLMLGLFLNSLTVYCMFSRLIGGELIESFYDCDKTIEYFYKYRQWLVILPLLGYALDVTLRLLKLDYYRSDHPTRRKGGWK